jgi:hypothetical protein
MMLPYTLGKFLCAPHLPCHWFTTLHAEEVHYALDDNLQHKSYEVYRLRRGRVRTRHERMQGLTQELILQVSRWTAKPV